MKNRETQTPSKKPSERNILEDLGDFEKLDTAAVKPDIKNKSGAISTREKITTFEEKGRPQGHAPTNTETLTQVSNILKKVSENSLVKTTALGTGATWLASTLESVKKGISFLSDLSKNISKVIGGIFDAIKKIPSIFSEISGSPSSGFEKLNPKNWISPDTKTPEKTPEKKERNKKKTKIVPRGKVVYGDPEKYLSDAKKENGRDYIWGEKHGKGGYDCSGLTQDKASDQGIEIPTASFQQCEVGKKIRNKQDLKIGDLVFFLTDKSRGLDVTHVGIYSGTENGKQMFFNARGKKFGIENTPLNEGGYKNSFKYARRIMSKNPEQENA